MRRSLGRFSLILGSASLLFGCPSDDSSGEGSTGDDPTTGVSASATTAMSTSTTTTPGTTTDEESSSGPGTETGTGTGPGTGTETGTGPGTETGTGTGTGGALDFQLNLMGYDPHVGNDIFIKIFAEDDTELGEATGTIDAGTMSFSIEGVVADGDSYNVRWWVDLTDNGACDPQPTDHMWEFTAQVADGSGLIVDHTHDTDWTDVCPFWR